VGQFLPADHSRGDANTVGGYTAVHSRPPAFEGKDGASYSVEVMTDETGDSAQPWAGYLFFVRYQHGDPIASGHVETPYLRFAPTEAEARALVDSMQLNEALAELNNAIAAESDESRPWYDAMRDEDAG
jgi:hypothetical protein